MGKSGYVYFLTGEGELMKIGKTTRLPTARIAEYSPLLPFETELLHYFTCENVDATERMIHECFECCHVRGEWYRVDQPNRDAILRGMWDYCGRLP